MTVEEKHTFTIHLEASLCVVECVINSVHEENQSFKVLLLLNHETRFFPTATTNIILIFIFIFVFVFFFLFIVVVRDLRNCTDSAIWIVGNGE